MERDRGQHVAPREEHRLEAVEGCAPGLCEAIGVLEETPRCCPAGSSSQHMPYPASGAQTRVHHSGVAWPLSTRFEAPHARPADREAPARVVKTRLSFPPTSTEPGTPEASNACRSVRGTGLVRNPDAGQFPPECPASAQWEHVFLGGGILPAWSVVGLLAACASVMGSRAPFTTSRQRDSCTGDHSVGCPQSLAGSTGSSRTRVGFAGPQLLFFSSLVFDCLLEILPRPKRVLLCAPRKWVGGDEIQPKPVCSAS